MFHYRQSCRDVGPDVLKEPALSGHHFYNAHLMHHAVPQGSLQKSLCVCVCVRETHVLGLETRPLYLTGQRMETNVLLISEWIQVTNLSFQWQSRLFLLDSQESQPFPWNITWYPKVLPSLRSPWGFFIPVYRLFTSPHHFLSFSVFLLIIYDTGSWPQDFSHIIPVLSYSFIIHIWERVLLSCPGRPWTWDHLVYATLPCFLCSFKICCCHGTDDMIESQVCS